MSYRLRTFLSCLLTVLIFLPASAQTTRILDGNYVTKYGRFRNYVINPDAQVNNASVTVTNATASRGTTTPVSENGTTEFNVTITSANGTVDFLASGATQAILGGQLCEVGFRGRGFQSTSAIQAFDGTNVLASYTFGLLANTQEVSLPFPCPTDPSNIRVRITDTATLSGTNEIAGVYFGRVRNIADAANITTWTPYTPTLAGFGTPSIDTVVWRRVGDTLQVSYRFTAGTVDGNTAVISIPTGLLADNVKFTNRPVGRWFRNNSSATTRKAGNHYLVGSIDRVNVYFGSDDYTAAASPASNLAGNVVASTGELLFGHFEIPISNWPTASSAVTPANQNIWGAADFLGTATQVNVTSATWSSFNSSNFVPTLSGSATATSGSCGAANDLGVCMPSLPAGSYRVTFTGTMGSSFSGTTTSCIFGIFDGTTRRAGVPVIAVASGDEAYISSQSAVFNYSTAQTNVAFRLQAVRNAGSGNCFAIQSPASNAERYPNFIVERIDTRITQPVFIQSPVRAAGTGVAPNAGEVGEQIRSAVTSSTNFPTSGQYGDATSISLTPGVWDISASTINLVNGAGTLTGYYIGVSSTAGNSTTGLVDGDNLFYFADNSAFIRDIPLAVPQYRVVVTSTTTYYLKVRAQYASGNPQYRGRISAVRVGDR